MRAGAEDLRDVALDELAGLGLFDLIADGDFLALPEQLADITFGGVVRDATHRRAVASGEREIEQAGRGLGVVKKHFVEIAEPEQQQRVAGNLGLDAPVLLHHRC